MVGLNLGRRSALCPRLADYGLNQSLNHPARMPIGVCVECNADDALDVEKPVRSDTFPFALPGAQGIARKADSFPLARHRSRTASGQGDSFAPLTARAE